MQRSVGWLPPLAFALLVFLAIDNYGASPNGYNRQVAGYVFVTAATLLVGAMVSGRCLHIERRRLFWAGAFAASVGISLWGSPNLYWSFNRIHLYYSVLLLGIALHLLHTGSVGSALEKYLFLIPLVHAVFLVYVVFWVVSMQAGADLPPNGVPHYANIRHFAYHGFIAAACATALFAVAKKLQATAFVLTTAALFGIILLGGRGALGAWLAFTAVMLLLSACRIGLLMFSAMALLISAGVVYFLDATGMVHAPSLFYRFEGGAERALYVADRIEVWTQSASAILQRPWFGYGPEGYALSGCCNRDLLQPHNFVLQFLLEFGLVGCALLSVLCVVVWRECCGSGLFTGNRWSQVPPELAILAAILVAFLAYAMIDGLLYHAIALVHFALFVALFLGAMRDWGSPSQQSGLPGPAAIMLLTGEIRSSVAGARGPSAHDSYLRGATRRLDIGRTS